MYLVCVSIFAILECNEWVEEMFLPSSSACSPILWRFSSVLDLVHLQNKTRYSTVKYQPHTKTLKWWSHTVCGLWLLFTHHLERLSILNTSGKKIKGNCQDSFTGWKNTSGLADLQLTQMLSEQSHCQQMCLYCLNMLCLPGELCLCDITVSSTIEN